MSVFSDLWDDAAASLDEAFGETVRVVPRVGGQYADPAPDPGRAVRDNVVATFSTGPGTGRLFQDRREGRSAIGATAVATSDPLLTIRRAAYAAIGYAIRPADAIVLSARPGAPVYGVARTETDSLGDVVLYLSRENAG